MSRPASITIDLPQLIALKADARGFSLLPRQPVHSLLSGRHASRLRGRGLAFEELRHYVQGDDVRTIDWKATARLRSPHVRVYSEERERPVLLVVDQRSPMFFGSQRTMKSVVAAELTALAAWRTLMSGDRTGGIVLGDDELVDLRPRGGRSAVLRLLHEVARLNQKLTTAAYSSPTVTLNAGLEAAARRAVHDYLVIVISDMHGADHDTQRLATRLAAHNDVLIVATYDPLGASLKNAPGMVAATADGPCPVPAGRGFPEAFRQTFQDVLSHWQHIFQALKVPVLPVSTSEPAVDQLRELFGRKL
ncbi:MAG: DUF58 domain-containing protein [Planctomycetaceae bacterium]|nr:DUF58 domain-containing protein [Planctomycetaceae bacterium]